MIKMDKENFIKEREKATKIIVNGFLEDLDEKWADNMPKQKIEIKRLLLENKMIENAITFSRVIDDLIRIDLQKES